jgi:Peptidase A4 family
MRTPRPLRLLALAGLASTLTLACAASAQASSARHLTAGAPDLGSAINSRGAAGYAVSTLAHYGDVLASFQVPTLHCGSAPQAITAGAAMGGAGGSYAASLLLGCRGGAAIYEPALSHNGKVITYANATISPGDVITVQVDTGSTGIGNVVVADRTTKKHWALGATFPANTEPFIGDRGWSVNGVLLGVPHFGGIHFYDCYVNNYPITSSPFTPQKYQRVNSQGVVQISTTAISGAGGPGFTTFFQHS